MTRVHELPIRVRYSETDQMGIVHHASYVVYLEEGRTALMRDLGFPYDEVERRGLGMAVRSVNLRYRSVCRYGDVVVVQTQVERLRGASVLYGYAVLRESDRELLATGTAEVACLNLADGFRPVPLPDDIRSALERHLAG